MSKNHYIYSILFIFFSLPAFSIENIECTTTETGQLVINELFASANNSTQQFIELKSLKSGSTHSWQLCYQQNNGSKVCTAIADQSYTANSYFILNLPNNKRLNQTQSEIVLLDSVGKVIDAILYCNDLSCTDNNGDATLWNWSTISACSTTITEHGANNKDIARIPDGTGTPADNGSDPTKGLNNNGAGGGSNNTLSSGFNCTHDSSVSAITGHIYTQLVSNDFTLSIAALKDSDGDSINDAVETNFANAADVTVSVELVDAGSSNNCSLMTAISNSQNLTFTSSDNGQKSSPMFNTSSAYRNVRCRIIDSSNSVTSCSSDAFVIRPTELIITAPSIIYDSSTDATQLKAGNDEFQLLVTAAPGYNTSTKINPDLLTSHDGLSPGYITEVGLSLNPTLGTATGTFTYSEVGLFRLEQYAIYDDTFSDIDKNNGDCLIDDFSRPISAKIGCNFGNEIAIPNNTGFLGRFIPNHFTLDSSSISPACSTFSYMSQPFNLAYSISARNAYNEITKKYHSSYVKMTGINFVAEQLNTLNKESPTSYNLNKSSSGTPRLESVYKDEALIYDKTDWNQGSYVVNNSTSRFLRDTSLIDGPFNSLEFGVLLVEEDAVNFNSLDMTVSETNDNCLSNALIDCTEKKLGTASIRYGRINISNAHGSELLDLPVPLSAQYWDGSNWAVNSDDMCSTVNLSIVDPVATDDLISSELCAWDTGSPGNSGLGCSTAGTTSNQFNELPPLTNGGQFNLNLKAPGAGNTGALDITAVVSDYLKFNWKNEGDANPTARITFGIYKGNSSQIYFREVY